MRGQSEPVFAEVVVEPALSSSALRLVVGSAAAFAEGSVAEGVGVSAGVSAERRVAGPVAVSAGALVAYDRYTVEPSGADGAALLDALTDAPGRVLDVPSQTTRTTVALEVPLDVSLAVVETRRARLGVSVGLTSAVVLSEEVADAGRRFVGEFVDDSGRDPALGPALSVSGQDYQASETAGPGRIDLARQLNLGVTLAPGTRAVSAEAFARLPLRERTRDLGLTVLGLRLRFDL